MLGESFKACEADGNFTFARKCAEKGVLAEIIGDGGDFYAAGQILERDFRVRPNSLDVRTSGIDSAGESCCFLRESSSCDKQKCQE